MENVKRRQFDINGDKASGVAALGADGTLWLHLDGETYSIENEKRQGRKGNRAGGGSADPGVLVAPMPGKIIKILVKSGEKVQTHQVVLVMEAMKMEYTLKAQAAGEVAEISCSAGDQVTLGQTLARLKL